MEELVGHTAIRKMGDWGGVVQYGGGDSSMIVMFYLKPMHNPAKSLENGSPTFDDKIFVRIHPPGERLNIIDREANEGDKKRFPIQWAAFQQNKPQESEGTPIDFLFPDKPSIAAALKASGVHTVEQCANLSAHAIETIGMGAQHWSNDAKRYIEVAEKGVKASQLAAIVKQKDQEINSLKHKMDLMETELNHLREHANRAVSMEDVQMLLAQNGGRGVRPTYPAGRQQPFDTQAAQIAANHTTRDLVSKSPKLKPVAEKPRRSRARIG